MSAETKTEDNAQARFGTFGGVFVPCVLTILGVIMFMRTGFVTGHAGLWLALAILGLSKVITTLTTLSLSAIATNLEMRVGGVYFMTSRVLGMDFGGSIGITLFAAQAVSVAFYAIGFAEALSYAAGPLLSRTVIFGMEGAEFASMIHFPQTVASLAVIGLFGLTFRGADIAIRAQYFVLGLLGLAILNFLVGGVLDFDPEVLAANEAPDFKPAIGFWVAFAIFFPAATGITAGVNLSGDLKNPTRSIPRGTLLAIGATTVIYAAQILLMAGSSSRQALETNGFEALQDMSLFGPLIIVGVLAATLSSSLGSFLGAPRILQAMGQDRLMKPMVFFGKGAGEASEPRRATLLTFAIALGVVWAGDLNAVAEVISMFFLIAYGMINLAAFVESKSGNPSFRPSFRWFHWTTALAGAVGCLVVMFKINETASLVALAVTGLIYWYLHRRNIRTNWGDAKRGYIFRRTRDSLLYLEGAQTHPKNWRPILVAVTRNPARARPLIRVGSWLESHRGLYSVAHISERPGMDLAHRILERDQARNELRRQIDSERILAFSEVVVVDNYLLGLSTFLQSYSIGGLRPNTALLSLPGEEDGPGRERMFQTIDTFNAFNLNVLLHKPGDIVPDRRKRTIDLWWRGEKNGSLMALYAYLVTQHSTWRGAAIRILRIVRDPMEADNASRNLEELRRRTRIPARIEVISSLAEAQEVIGNYSGPETDLVLLGMGTVQKDDLGAFLDQSGPLLEVLPSTLLIWSNGEADVFA
ncbi:MAG: amino acid permease [Deltaproteobacteria bacterium]|nr:amino acid permease [Deltaproteobacteria bacterium]